MARLPLIKQIVRPLLKENSDIGLIGNALVFLPIRHIIRAIVFEYPKFLKDIMVYKSRDHFFGQKLWMPPGGQEPLILRRIQYWDRSSAEKLDLLRKALQEEAIPYMRSLENIDLYAKSMGWLNLPEWAKDNERHCFRMLPCMIARGALEVARQLARIIEPFDEAYYRVHSAGSIVDLSLYPPIRKLCQLLAVNDRKGMAEILHEMEEASITKSGLTHLWERTPFPIELMDA